MAAQIDRGPDAVSLGPPVIRTPDQRLRVFVSSTLKELAPERKSARAAIERLHLAPVMFELGARPHPPRELYRAYLQQSHVFVGLYWESYGWVAPDEAVSGLEDEYNLAPTLPKLIYIKEPARSRDAGLTALLGRIRQDDNASFKYFSSPDELGELLEADLATMLAESFERSREAPSDVRSIVVAAEETGVLPNPLSEIVGRQLEVHALEALLTREHARLVTLTGPGGIGKSRLAIDVANRVGPDFGGGMWFVDLATVHDPSLVPTAIAQSIGVRNAGDGPLMDKITTALAHRKALLVIDNFEQVLDAAPTLSSLLAAAPEITMLVTSRTLLRVSGERTFEVGPLGLPSLARHADVASVLGTASAALFTERARAVKPDFEVTADNVEAVARVCLVLEGVPLALELAAARIRILPPAALIERLDRGLALLSGGARDLPARQQTLRSTIEWSTQLLRDDENQLLEQLGVFAGGFPLEAAEEVCLTPAGSRVLDLLETLIDSSLVRQQERGERPFFTILATVREYALERLADRGRLDEVRRRHASYYLRVSRHAKRKLDGAEQARWVARLADERDNLRAAERFWLDQREWTTAAEFAWNLYLYWWIGGHLGEVRVWMDEVLGSGEELADLTRAEALYFTRAITFWQDPDERIVPGLAEAADLFQRQHDRSGEALALVSLALAMLSAPQPDPVRADAELERGIDLFRQAGDRWGEAMAFVSRGRVALMQQKPDGALGCFTESLSLTKLQRDDLGTAIALHHLGWANLMLGDRAAAERAFDESLAISARLGHVEGVAYGLEGLVGIAAAANEVDRAGRLLGAAESLREQTGLYNAPSFSFHRQAVDAILAGPAAGDFEQARAEGRLLSLEEAVSVALPAVVVEQRTRAHAVGARQKEALVSIERNDVPRARADTVDGTDAILSSTRWLGILILPFLVAASVLLYGFPFSTDRLFAWTIKPPLTAMLLGSAYVGGIWFFGRVVAERRWHRVAKGFPAVIVFATLAGVATILHWDRFHFGHISFVTWVVLYLTTPFLVFAAWLANRRADSRMPEAGDGQVPRVLRFVLAVIGVLALVCGLALFVFPTSFLDLWAWQLTPLTARIVGAVLTLPGMVDLLLLVDARWSAFRLIFQAQLVSLAFIVLALVLRRDDLAWSRLAAPALVGGIIASLGLYLGTYIVCERR